jgi:hypothetical protein
MKKNNTAYKCLYLTAANTTTTSPTTTTTAATNAAATSASKQTLHAFLNKLDRGFGGVVF